MTLGKHWALPQLHRDGVSRWGRAEFVVQDDSARFIDDLQPPFPQPNAIVDVLVVGGTETRIKATELEKSCAAGEQKSR